MFYSLMLPPSGNFSFTQSGYRLAQADRKTGTNSLRSSYRSTTIPGQRCPSVCWLIHTVHALKKNNTSCKSKGSKVFYEIGCLFWCPSVKSAYTGVYTKMFPVFIKPQRGVNHKAGNGYKSRCDSLDREPPQMRSNEVF